MSRELAMDKKLGIEQLIASGMPKRQIARTLGIDRKSIDRHLAELKAKGASQAEAPTGEAPLDLPTSFVFFLHAKKLSRS